MANNASIPDNGIPTRAFLKDVLLVALSAYGGPAMHIALFNKRLVELRKYVSSEELLEYFSLCQMLPGPSSTQTLMSIAYKHGGIRLAVLSLLVWVSPAAIALIALSLVLAQFNQDLLQALRFIQPIALAFVVVAGIKMVKKAVKNRMHMGLAVLGLLAAGIFKNDIGAYIATPAIFPLVLVLGGVLGYLLTPAAGRSAEDIQWNIPWRYLAAFAGLFLLMGGLSTSGSHRLVELMENNYRFGSLVFGGGNVLIPMVMEQFVYFKHYLTELEFMTGIGLVQAVPGPIFTIATFSSAMAMQDLGVGHQILGGLVGTVFIFLPGMLLIFFVFPVWSQVKQLPLIQRALPGVVATSAGLVLAAAYLMFLPVCLDWVGGATGDWSQLNREQPVHWLFAGVALVTGILLYKTKIPSPWFIVVGLLLGVLF